MNKFLLVSLACITTSVYADAIDAPPNGKLTLSGYFCAQCDSTPDPASLIANINENYDRVNVAFLGWNPNGTMINQFDDDDTSFRLTKEMVENLQSNGKQVLISLGGGAANLLNCASYNNKKFIDNFITGIVNYTTLFGFDGVDFDIEHRTGDYVECAQLIAQVMTTLKRKFKLIVTMAPQMSNLDPQQDTVSAGCNEQAPLVAMAMPRQVLDFVQPQMYNNWAQVETTRYAQIYANTLANGYTATADGKPYRVVIRNPQLLLGYPASPSGAGQGYIDPADLCTMYQNMTQNGDAIAGFMAWDIGWDEQNNWDFANTIGDCKN